jgi:glycine betaine/proline transport system substrate-binding protein
MKSLRIVLYVLSVVFLTTGAFAKSLKMSRANWDTGYFHAEIYKLGLEELGYKIKKLKDVKPSVFYIGAAQGDVDLWVNGWEANQKAYIDETKGRVIPVGYVAKGGGMQGYLIDKKTAEKYNIKSILDIKEHVKKFDRDNDGKADLVACPPGWGCEKVITSHFEELNLGEFINPLKAEYSATLADTVAAYKNGQSIFYYTWAPNWIFGTLKLGQDVVWIHVPTKSRNKVAATNATMNEINFGFALDDIRPFANKSFLKNNPSAKKFLEIANIPVADISAQNFLMYKGEKSQRDIERHAKDWIKKNQKKFDGWITEARKFNM